MRTWTADTPAATGEGRLAGKRIGVLVENAYAEYEIFYYTFRFAEEGAGINCHGMWLVGPAPELIRGRRVVVHTNLLSHVRNIGAIYINEDVVVDDDLVTGRSAEHCHLFARKIIDLLSESAQG